MPSERFNIRWVSDPARGAVPMSCANADCQASRNGWITPLDSMNNVQHAQLARTLEQVCLPVGTPHPDVTRRRYVKLTAEEAPAWMVQHATDMGLSAEAFTIAENAAPGSFLYVFPPGQNCFRQHMDRDVVFAHNAYVHTRPLDFNEDFNEHAYRVEQLARRG